VAGQ